MKKNYYSALLGVTLLSAGVISLEISLTRLFSSVLRYHFVFLVISIAICGLGIGSMLCSLFKNRDKIPLGLAVNLSSWSAILFLIIFLKLILPISPESLWLIALLVIVPFIFAGLFLAGLFSKMSEKSNVLYAFDLLGAGFASFFIIFALNLLGAINGCIVSAILLGFSGIAFKGKSLLSYFTFTVISLLLILNINYSWLDIPPLPTKDTTYAKALFTEIGDKDRIKIIHTEWDSFARTDVVEDKAMGDNILLVYTNGHVPTRLIRYFPESDKYAIDANIADVTFSLKNPKSVLCIGPGGGLDVLLAKKSGAEVIVGVEINPAIEKIMELDKFKAFSGAPYDMKDVSLITADGRTYVKNSKDKFDMIFLSLAKTGTGTFGIALVEGYIYTIEAFEDYLDKLSDDGSFVFVTDGYLMNIRLFNTAIQALMKRQNISMKEALTHVALIAVSERERNTNPYEYALIVGKRPFLLSESSRLLSLCQKNNYSPLFIPGKVVAPDFQPLLHKGATLDYFSSCFYDTWKADLVKRRGIKNSDNVPLLNLQPVTDDKPFFLDFSYGIPFMLIPLFIGTLSLLFIIGVGVYSFEVIFDSKKSVKEWNHPIVYIFLYFFSLGMAFMMVEIPLIQKMILILGHPTYALTVVLFFLLSGAGLGSYVAGLDKLRKIKRFNQVVCLIVSIASFIFVSHVNSSYEFVLSLPLYGRIAWSGALSFGLGFFLGMPFPIGMRALGNFKNRYIPWMWCVNGFSSLLGSILAAIGAKFIGFHLIFLCGSLFYLLAALCASENWRKK